MAKVKVKKAAKPHVETVEGWGVLVTREDGAGLLTNIYDIPFLRTSKDGARKLRRFLCPGNSRKAKVVRVRATFKVVEAE